MKVELSLRTDMDALRQAKSGALWGTVWLEWGESAFPERGWTDIAVRYIGQLVAATCDVRKVGNRRDVPFYDGPLGVTITRATDDLFSLSMNDDRVVGTIDVSVAGAHWFASLRDIGQGVVREWDRRGWHGDDDVAFLRAALRRI